MKRIFAIGGGEIGKFETLEIDRKIVESTKKEKPRALFIPTASGEADGYVESFEKVYGTTLGCEIDTLLLLGGETTVEQAKDKILSADLVYVGGGNTQMMIDIWKKYEVDQVLKLAYETGTIMSGVSAGSICWFESGHSDSFAFEGNSEWSYTRVEGTGILKGMHCPHYNEDKREEDFAAMITKYSETGIAVENNCAIEFTEDKYKIHRSEKTAKAYKVFKSGDTIKRIELNNHYEYKSVEELL